MAKRYFFSQECPAGFEPFPLNEWLFAGVWVEELHRHVYGWIVLSGGRKRVKVKLYWRMPWAQYATVKASGPAYVSTELLERMIKAGVAEEAVEAEFVAASL